MLTQKQKDLLLLIDRKIKAVGVPPSYDEMKDALGLASKSGIHRLITALEERGFIRRLPNKARALEVLSFPKITIMPPPLLPRMMLMKCPLLVRLLRVIRLPRLKIVTI